LARRRSDGKLRPPRQRAAAWRHAQPRLQSLAEHEPSAGHEPLAVRQDTAEPQTAAARQAAAEDRAGEDRAGEDRATAQRQAGPEHQESTGRPGRKARRDLRVTEADLGHPLGERATLLQFSSTFCAPCRATRQVLSDVARSATGVTHVEIDVADRLDLVRTLDVRRTPTTFLLGPDGSVTSRASGPPHKADVLAALGEVA
jgi:thiol-disulfide isomerase/thioredoxin